MVFPTKLMDDRLRAYLGQGEVIRQVCEAVSGLRTDMDRRINAVDQKLDLLLQSAPPHTPPADLPSGSPTPDQLTYAALTGNPPPPLHPPQVAPLGSRICRQADLSTDSYRFWMHQMKQPALMRRKSWEWFFIAQSLWEREMLRPGRSGIGFGVGGEPLSSLFAALGSKILATDMAAADAERDGWAQTAQYAADASALNQFGICPAEIFAERVEFRNVDMNQIPPDLAGRFDFCWSSCCFEHLGSLEHGMRFVENAMDVLKPGGIAVHTTEYNMTSATETFESPTLSLYRKQDIEEIIRRLERAGHRTEPVDWNPGNGLADGYVDLPPYLYEPHLRLKILQFDVTSIGLVATKAE